MWTTVDEIYFVTKLAGFEYTEHFTKEAISPMNAVPIVRAQNVKMGRFIENRNEAITIELSEQLSRSALYKDCLLMTFIGAGIGETCIFHANKRNHLAPNVAKIEPFDENINMEYALFFFMSSLGQQGVTNISKSTAQASLSMATIRELVIPIPPIKEQSRIAKEVVKWFSLIECIEENTGNLQETIKQTKSKILDLAIHGKLVPQDPNDEPASELLKRINPKAEITCDTPQYGKLPKGWCSCTLRNVCSFTNGFAFSSDAYKNNGIPLVRISNITNEGKIDLNSCVYIQDEIDEQYIIEKGDFLVAMSGATTGKMGVYTYGEISYLNQRVGKIKASKALYTPYMHYLMYSQVDNILKMAYGGAQPNISAKAILAIRILLPPLAEQQRIVAKIEDLFTQLDKIEASL